MILMIDNYDSFVYNIYQYILDTTNESIKCVRNDEITIDEIKELNTYKEKLQMFTSNIMRI